MSAPSKVRLLADAHRGYKVHASVKAGTLWVSRLGWGPQAQQHAKQAAAENAGLAKEVVGMRHALAQLQAAHVTPTMDTTLRVRPSWWSAHEAWAGRSDPWCRWVWAGGLMYGADPVNSHTAARQNVPAMALQGYSRMVSEV